MVRPGANGKHAALVLALLVTGVPSAHAGIMESVGGFFSGAMEKIKGLFGGGKGKADTGELGKFLDQVEASQQKVYELQKNVIDTYNAGDGAASPTDPAVQAKLDELAEASRANEDLYLQLLKARAALIEKKVDVSSFQKRLETLQQNQQRIEEGYQKIQDYNKDTGFFEPPPAAGVATSPSPPPLAANFVDDPRVQRAIDEWLGLNGLDSFGRQVGAGQGVTIRANYNPDTDNRTRHRYVWETYWMKNVRSGGTLRDYVLSRLNGAPPATGEPPGQQEPGPVTMFEDPLPDTVPTQVATGETGTGGPQGTGGVETGTGTALASAVQPATAPQSPLPSTLSEVNREYAKAVSDLQSLQRGGRGGTTEGRELLERVKALQVQRNKLMAAGSK